MVRECQKPAGTRSHHRSLVMTSFVNRIIFISIFFRHRSTKFTHILFRFFSLSSSLSLFLFLSFSFFLSLEVDLFTILISHHTHSPSRRHLIQHGEWERRGLRGACCARQRTVSRNMSFRAIDTSRCGANASTWKCCEGHVSWTDRCRKHHALWQIDRLPTHERIRVWIRQRHCADSFCRRTEPHRNS